MFKTYFKIPLIYRVGAGFILGAALGISLSYAAKFDCFWVDPVIKFMAPFGTILVTMLKMVVIPIIFFSITYGAASLKFRQFGKIGSSVIIWYFFTSIFASFFGTIMAYVMKPNFSEEVKKVGAEFLDQVNGMQMNSGPTVDFGTFLAGIFQNPFAALAEGNFLPVIIFSILFGIAARIVMDQENEKYGTVEENSSIYRMFEMFNACQKTCFKLTDWVMEYFPIGVLSLTMVQFAVYGPSLFGPYLRIAGSVIFSILLMVFAVYPLMLAITIRENPFPIIWKFREPIITAFLTRSSAATLPVSLANASRIGIRKEVASFALPVGATINMDGVCIHLPVFAMLAVNMLNIELSMLQVGVLVLSIVFASIGAGGIPGGSIFLLFMILQNLGIDPQYISIIVALALGINPILDMFETACNVAGDNVCSYIVAKRNKMLDTEVPVSK